MCIRDSATTAHRSFVRMERTEDGGVRFLPEVLAAGGRFSVYLSLIHI